MRKIEESPMGKVLVAFAITGTLILAAGSSWAHHSASMYDLDREIMVEGVVKEFQYTNPHAWLLVDVTNDDGTVTTWGFESSSRTSLRLKGVRANTFLPGMKLTVTGNPMKDGRPAAHWKKAITEDGTVFNVDNLSDGR